MKKLNEFQEGQFRVKVYFNPKGYYEAHYCENGDVVYSITGDTYSEVMIELKAGKNPKQYIPTECKMRFVLEELSLTLFQVGPNRFQLFDVNDGNRWSDIVKEGNANFTWEDYADWIGDSAGELIEIITENNTYRRIH